MATDRRLLTRASEADLAKLAQISDEDKVLAQIAWREKAPTLKPVLDAEPHHGQ